jgi:hypothetical protein
MCAVTAEQHTHLPHGFVTPHYEFTLPIEIE